MCVIAIAKRAIAHYLCIAVSDGTAAKRFITSPKSFSS